MATPGVNNLDLLPQMKAKSSSSRHDRFVGEHGDDVYELEAMPPDVLQGILHDHVAEVLNLDLYNAEIDAEKDDAAFLETKRRLVFKLLAELGW